MSKKHRRNKFGKKRRPLADTEKFRERMMRSQEECAQVSTEPVKGGGVITGPMAIVDLLRTHGQDLYPEKP